MNRSGTLRSRVLAIGELRDAVLFLATAIYVLGYVTWAIYSADQGLGVLPPLEGQYFLAGVVPLLIVLLSLVVLAAIAPAPKEIHRRLARYGSPAVLLGSLVIFIGVVQRSNDVPETPFTASALFVSVIGMYIGMALRVVSGEEGIGWMVWLIRFAVPVMAVAALLLYATRLFPLLSRELGGPRPFCVELDVTAADVSRRTLADLKIDATTEPSVSTIRSAPLWLHFDGGGTLVLSQGRGRPMSTPIRIRDSAVPVVLSSTGCQG